jgi:hypothetical protein
MNKSAVSRLIRFSRPSDTALRLQPTNGPQPTAAINDEHVVISAKLRSFAAQLLLLLALVIIYYQAAAQNASSRAAKKVISQPIDLVTLRLQLAVAYDQAGAATGIQVSYQLPAKAKEKRALSLFLDEMYPLKRTQDTVANLLVKDEKGIVPLLKPVHLNDKTHYQTYRAVDGLTTVSYFIQAASALNRFGPHIDMQQSGGGLAGSYVSILLLPDFPTPLQTKLVWYLKPGDLAVSTFGKGNAVSQTPLQRSELLYAQFVVGQLYTNPADVPNQGFSVSGLGLTKKQIGHSLPTFTKVYEAMRQQLHGSAQTAFRFFFRSFAGGPIMSGSATQASSSGSFVIYMPPTTSLDEPEVLNLVAHEMIHVFVKGAETDLYVEGIADYLSALLPYQTGLTSRENFLGLINAAAAQYYTNSIRSVADSTYDKLKWSTTNAWVLAYSRGMLYFANLDAKLSRLPGKHPTVVSLVIAMNELAKTEKPSWETVLRKQAGQWAVDDYNLALSGQLLTPEPGAFGTEFVIKKREAKLFSLGYKEPRGIRKGQVVRGLDPSSNAAKAGLKEGDIFAETVNLNPVYSSYDKPVQVSVNRNGSLLSLSFLPQGEPVEAWQWRLKN